jgi:hypothetical protein
VGFLIFPIGAEGMLHVAHFQRGQNAAVSLPINSPVDRPQIREPFAYGDGLRTQNPADSDGSARSHIGPRIDVESVAQIARVAKARYDFVGEKTGLTAEAVELREPFVGSPQSEFAAFPWRGIAPGWPFSSTVHPVP